MGLIRGICMSLNMINKNKINLNGDNNRIKVEYKNILKKSLSYFKKWINKIALWLIILMIAKKNNINIRSLLI